MGGRILEEWNFADSIVQAVRHQFAPQLAGEDEFLASIVMAADRCCRDLSLGYEDEAGEGAGARIGEIPTAFQQRIEANGYPDLSFYLIELKDSICHIDEFARSVFSDT